MSQVESMEAKLLALEESFEKRLTSLEERHGKEIAELKAKNLEVTKEMAILNEQIKDKINWDQVHLVKNKKLLNPKGNSWDETKTKAKISADSLIASDNSGQYQFYFALDGFGTSLDLRKNNLARSIVYYYEVIQMSLPSWRICVGLSTGEIPDGTWIGKNPNSYGFEYGSDYCWITGKIHDFEWPYNPIKPDLNGQGDVVGCGLLMNSNGLSIFFTLNGTVMGKQISIRPTACVLFPTVRMKNAVLQANFGDDLAKPFKYDIEKCKGLVFE